MSGLSLPFADDRILLNLAAYWSAKRGAHPLPPRAAIDPLDMPRRLLPHLALVEPTGQDGEIRFRLVGTELVQRFGRDATGKTSADLYADGEYRRYVEQIYSSVIERAQPLYIDNTRRFMEEGSGRVRRLLLPVAAEAGSERVGFVLSTISWSAAQDTDGHQPPPSRQRQIAVEALEKGVLQATLRGLLDPP
ncbi:MAG: PAS domain-containing protein [Ferrovibrio sp.]|uniref:PAS domain-containing protein n=1 Tax=Ferrovibrio sp. TaxID=1917215 RepID=UPI002625EF93|nr:PAS domain-containing protein [Ferrovibrio sp.]MCW0233714.1 PAS domain-containing protein [Ferrovibrio sp.]